MKTLAGIADQAHEHDLAIKFYYTVRELSNHAVELFALKALDGEVLADTDPYTIPQPGYCQEWDCHGGAAFLHQHLVSHYTECWQQQLPDGQIDAAVCDEGTGRFLNYYIEGLAWSVLHSPHMDGVYCARHLQLPFCRASPLIGLLACLQTMG